MNIILYQEETELIKGLGHIPNVDTEELRKSLGDVDVTVEFSVEWTE